MSVCACVHASKYVCMCVCIMYMCVTVGVCMCVCMCVCRCVCVCVCMCVCMCVCNYVSMYVRMHVCMYDFREHRSKSSPARGRYFYIFILGSVMRLASASVRGFVEFRPEGDSMNSQCKLKKPTLKDLEISSDSSVGRALV